MSIAEEITKDNKEKSDYLRKHENDKPDNHYENGKCHQCNTCNDFFEFYDCGNCK